MMVDDNNMKYLLNRRDDMLAYQNQDIGKFPGASLVQYLYFVK